MRLGIARATTVVLQLAAVGRATAQSPPSFDSLAARATVASARFADRRAAVADGYRRIGTDFPGMGEHWLNPDVMLGGTLDPTRPTLLIYANVGGRATLLGLGFVAVTHGDSAPSALPGWPVDWHEHSGLLSDESGAGRHESARDGTHVWVSHVWTALPNPNGRYTPDNWALPFVRASLPAPSSVDADAGRAMSLVVSGDEYLRSVLTDAGLRTTGTATAVDSAIARARARAADVATSMRSSSTIDTVSLVALGGIWRELQAELRAQLGPSIDELLAPPHTLHAGHDHRVAPP